MSYVTPRNVIEVQGARGKSFADILRATRQFGVNPEDTDAEAVDKFAAATTAETLGYRNEVAAVANSLSKIENIGRAAAPITGTALNSSSYAFANAVQNTGKIRKFWVWSLATTEISLRRWSKAGDVFSQVGDAIPLTVVPGLNTFNLSVDVNEGEHVGFYTPAGTVTYTSEAGESGGVYSGDTSGSSFTDATASTSLRIQAGFEIAYPGVTAERLDEIQADVVETSTTATAAAAAAAAAQAKIDGVTFPITADGIDRTASSYSVFASGAPASLQWATGFMGSELPAGALIPGFGIPVHRAAGVATFEVCLYSRAATKLTVPDGADTAEWADWVSASASAITEGTFGEIAVTSPTSLVNDTNKAYYLAVRAKNGSGTIVNMGIGGVGDGSGRNQVQRGFYRDSGDAGWLGVPTTQTLGVRVKVVSSYKIAPEALPDTSATSNPSKKKALLIMLGRAELALDNSGFNTFRRVFALPANAKRVTRVIFAHATATAQAITRAAIAPLASAANFAATGAPWTPLAFGTGTEAGSMPARPGANRFGYLASRRNPVALLDRTDTPGAAKLVIISAYMGGGGSPILLGHANDSYKANWEARADFPMVMRHQAGDSVSTPANFTSTTNDHDGTPIAGLEIECDGGELMTIGFVGNSITNGAGIASGGVQQYGQGWAETLAYGQNSKRRGVVPVLLGWSGLSMAGIGNNAADLYAFAKAQSLPVPNILFAPNASPNSMPVPNTLAAMNAQRAISDAIVGTALGAGSQVVTWTALPVDPTVKNFGASDSFRRDYNDADRSAAGQKTGTVIADYAAAVSGGLDANGQELYNDAYEDDGIHPNAAGHALLATIGARAAQAVMPAAGYVVGGLVT